jgi:putative ABC transport system substrate-binding protein
MKRIARTVAAVVAALYGVALAPSAGAQQAGNKIPRIGYLVLRSSPLVDAFREGMRELGWIEGQNLLIEYRWAEQDERFPPAGV